MFNMITALVYDWTMGVVVIGVFAFVCIAMVAIIINFMNSGKRKKGFKRNKR